MRSLTMTLAVSLLAAGLTFPVAGCRQNQDGVTGAEGSAPVDAPTGQSFTSGTGSDTGPANDDNAGDNTALSTGDSLAGPNNAGGTLGATPIQRDGPGRNVDDTVITTRVKAALVAEPALKGRDISVDTHEGEVSLSGILDSQAQIDRALQIAYEIEGVRNVNNRLTVRR